MFLLLSIQRVHDDYTIGGWTKHHTQMLEYEETNVEHTKLSVIFEVTEPANDRQKGWEVTVITANCVSYTCSLLFMFEWFHFHLSSLLHTFAPFWVGMFVCFSSRNQLWIN